MSTTEGGDVSPHTRKPYAWLENEIVHHLIKPKIDHLLGQTRFESKTALAVAMKEAYGCTASVSTLSKWLDTLGYVVKKVAVITTAEGQIAGVEPDLPPEGVVFDNERQAHRPPSQEHGGLMPPQLSR